MSRLVLTLGVLVSTLGCSSAGQEDLQPFVAAAGRYSLMAGGTDAPKPGVCANCGGKGFVGDGRVSVPCPVCRPGGGTQ